MNLLDAMALNTDVDQQNILYGSYRSELGARKSFHDMEIVGLRVLLGKIEDLPLSGNDPDHLRSIHALAQNSLQNNMVVSKQIEETIASIDELLAKLDSHGKEEGATEES